MGLLSIKYIEISSNLTLVYTLIMYVIMTTGSAGGLLWPYKGMVLA